MKSEQCIRRKELFRLNQLLIIICQCQVLKEAHVDNVYNVISWSFTSKSLIIHQYQYVYVSQISLIFQTREIMKIGEIFDENVNIGRPIFRKIITVRRDKMNCV